MINYQKNKEIFGDYNAKPVTSALDKSHETIIKLVIPLDYAGLRLDQALARLLPNWSRNRLQTWILEKRITVDAQVTSPKQKVWGHEQIQVEPQDSTSDISHTAEAIKLDIIYEDDTLIIVNKPVGMVVHPGNGNWQGTLLNALLHHAAQLNNVPRAGIVHRLDKDTSGLLVVAKTLEAQTNLVRQLQEHAIKRDYLALVHGQVKDSRGSCVDAPIGRHPVQRTKMTVTERGKQARTHYRVLEQLGNFTLLQCSLETGRTHQIRVHMHWIGYPLVGDATYGSKPKKITYETRQIITGFSRQALHAQRLELAHPHNKQKMRWEATLPEDMNSLLQELREYHYQPKPDKNFLNSDDSE